MKNISFLGIGQQLTSSLILISFFIYSLSAAQTETLQKQLKHGNKQIYTISGADIQKSEITKEELDRP